MAETETLPIALQEDSNIEAVAPSAEAGEPVATEKTNSENTAEEKLGEFDNANPPVYTTPYDKPARSNPVKDRFPHRHYVTLHPVCNKLLALKWDERQKDRHSNKIGSMNSQLKEVPMFKIPVNLKKIQFAKDRKSEIERNDLITKERIRHILKTDMNRQSCAHDKPFIMRKSDNINQLHKEKKIRSENEKKKPQYNNIRWIEDRIIQVKCLTNISSFPQKYIDMGKELEEMLAHAKRQILEKKNAPVPQAVPRRKPLPVNNKPVKIVAAGQANSKKKNGASKLPGIAQNEANAKIPRESSPVDVAGNADSSTVSSNSAPSAEPNQEAIVNTNQAVEAGDSTQAATAGDSTQAAADDDFAAASGDSAQADVAGNSTEDPTQPEDQAQNRAGETIQSGDIFADNETETAEHQMPMSENLFSREPTKYTQNADEPILPGKELDEVAE